MAIEHFPGVGNCELHPLFNERLGILVGACDPPAPRQFGKAEEALIVARRGEGLIVLGQHMRKLESPDVRWLDLEDEEGYQTVNIICRTDKKTEAVKRFIRYCTR